MTEGEFRVGVSFNPGGHPEVNRIKKEAEKLIDDLMPVVDLGGPAGRCAAVAQTQFETAAMWAVKAVTKPKNRGCDHD